MKKWIPNENYCLASTRLLQGAGKLLWAWRDIPINPQDSGWRFLSDMDSQTTLINNENTQIVGINEIANIEPMIAGIYFYPPGADFQFSDYQGNKHFVYNDNFQKVKLVTSTVDLPIETAVFQEHFPNYMPQTDNLDNTTQELDIYTNIFLGMRTDIPDDVELYIIVGLVLGYLLKRSQRLPIYWPDQRNILLKLMTHKYNVEPQKMIAYIDSYKQSLNNDSYLAAEQLLMYGQVMYEWHNTQEYEKIHNEYINIVRHHRKA